MDITLQRAPTNKPAYPIPYRNNIKNRIDSGNN